MPIDKDAFYFLKSLAFYKKSLANSPLNNNGVTFDTVLAMACYIVSAVSGASKLALSLAIYEP